MSGMSSHEGRKRLIEAFDEISNKKQRSASEAGPLHDVVACLTGFASDKKAQIHKLIESMGGT